ncbi:MAG TPA: trypsin-like peptidase domain-containing protein [Candidatus Acidoferrales bacterium]|nr:trypsin-like peptidase domain-containing protein [Candidatus Acidoferrales bacterium]
MTEILSWARNKKLLATLLVMATLGVGIIIGTLVSGRAGASRTAGESPAIGKPLAVPDPVVMSSTFSAIVKKVEPAVVNISTTQVIEQAHRPVRPRANGGQGGNGGNGGGNGANGGNGQGQDPLEDYFDRFFGGQDQGGDGADRGSDAERSLGSGVILDPSGFILTNEHVVDQATRVQVTLIGDPTKYTAKVIGTDTLTDLAVVKIDAGHDLPYAKLGNSDGVQVGDWVLAIGSPFNLTGTVTAGIISAKDRGGLTQQQFQRFLQTDAAINPGNSGGPLVDLAGQVIGINTAILTGARSYGNEGVGFALPSTMALGVYNQIVTKGHVTRASIGVTFVEGRSTNPITLRNLGAPYGVVLETIVPNGPADKAGIKVGDVVTSINGKAIHVGSDLIDPVSATPLGDKVRVSIVHDRQTHELTLPVEDRDKLYPELASKGDTHSGDDAGGEAGEFGIRVADLNADRAHRLGLQGTTQGVMVLNVDPASFGEDIGLSHGDVIIAINNKPVTNSTDFRTAVDALKPGQDVVFKVLENRGAQGIATALMSGVVPPKNQ